METNYTPDPMPDDYETGDIRNGCDIDGGSGTTLAMQEEDGSPAISSVTTLVVTNGTLTDNGGGTATLITGAGGAADGTLFGVGSPEGAVSGSRGDTYIDTSGLTFWLKRTGDATNTGWVQFI